MGATSSVVSSETVSDSPAPRDTVSTRTPPAAGLSILFPAVVILLLPRRRSLKSLKCPRSLKSRRSPRLPRCKRPRSRNPSEDPCTGDGFRRLQFRSLDHRSKGHLRSRKHLPSPGSLFTDQDARFRSRKSHKSRRGRRCRKNRRSRKNRNGRSLQSDKCRKNRKSRLPESRFTDRGVPFRSPRSLRSRRSPSSQRNQPRESCTGPGALSRNRRRPKSRRSPKNRSLRSHRFPSSQKDRRPGSTDQGLLPRDHRSLKNQRDRSLRCPSNPTSPHLPRDPRAEMTSSPLLVELTA